jgi:hypothetical protein
MMFVCKERVTRDGYLVAFEGQQMTEEEARAKGLLPEHEKKPAKKAASRKAPAKRTAKK